VDLLSHLGLGVAIGMLAGTTGTNGSARGRMTILAAVIGLVVGYLIAGILGALMAMAGAIVGCLVISDLIAGASRREGSGAGALAFLLVLAALVVVAVSILQPLIVLLVLIGLLWLGVSRHRRARRKHAGLRVLR
jgi:uncharacterized protein YqgC (DUF456 family)